MDPGMPLANGVRLCERALHPLCLKINTLYPHTILNSRSYTVQLVRDKLSEFVREAARHISTTADVSPELQQLRYCLCAVARQCGIQLGHALPQAFPSQVRHMHQYAAVNSVGQRCCVFALFD